VVPGQTVVRGVTNISLPELAAYSKISVRQLRNYLSLPPSQALPCYRPGRKVVVRRTEFDAWFTQYRQRGKTIITTVLRELGLDPERMPPTRMPSRRSEKA
jgi:hypothetical protein